MKKLFLFVAFLYIASGSMAQNIQLFYDFGKDRGYPTSTIEMYKPDKWGSTFFFFDLNYSAGDVKGVSLSYFEIARAFTIKKGPFAAHIEYNGGFGQFVVGSSNMAYQINDAGLAGLDYTIHNEDFTKLFTLSVLYKYIQGKHDATYQLTGVWGLHMLDRKVTFCGFADFWREDNSFTNETEVTETEFVFLSEPQLWYNLTEHFSLGTEIEIGCNFGGVEGFRINPCVGAKWIF